MNKRTISIIIVLVFITTIFASLIFIRKNTTPTPPSNSALPLISTPMLLSSPAFKPNSHIPPQHTCDGRNFNPPLEIFEVPEETKSLALIVDDPDAPMGTWVHWTVWNMDPATRSISENSVPANAIEGVTSFGTAGYGGPCPPSGTHRYFFKLYALDTALSLSANSNKAQLVKAMEGRILASAELIGLYQRNK